ncbi:MAG: DUF1573 domain-containing protein [Deltaproteobacteria bacterium]|nr:DUF1573 domain-containing protein [Deltaproteobacteria bacterium]
MAIKNPKALVFMTIILAWVGAGPAVSGAQPGPRADIAATVHDFGEVYEHQELSHTFLIKNSGSAALRILNIDPDCACTAADYDRSIPPGGQGKLKLTIAPYSVLRHFTKETKVSFNDPRHPVAVFKLKGYGKPVIDIQPSHVMRLRGKAGQEVTGQARLVSYLAAPLEITSFRTDIPGNIEVNLQAEHPGKSYLLRVRDKTRAPGNYKGTIELATNSREKPRLVVRVFAEIE